LFFFTVKQQTCVIIERFGKFNRIAHPGLGFKWPFIEQISGSTSLKLIQLDVMVETKTQDDVFVHMNISVQYRVLPDKIYEAYYTLDDPEQQICSFVFDVVRARVPTIRLDDVFSKKDEIANAVTEELRETMNTVGFDILKALVTDINPDAKVKKAMNEINEAQRLRAAALERGEAEKIIQVKRAEAEAESAILQGQGIAGKRAEIVKGLNDSLSQFKASVENSSTQELMNIILMTQYFDMLKEVGGLSKSNTILLPHSPAGLGDTMDQMRIALWSGISMLKQSPENKTLMESQSDH
jgi:regulator of protease activity HflC (stomatin/prohibitin superfamily)